MVKYEGNCASEMVKALMKAYGEKRFPARQSVQEDLNVLKGMTMMARKITFDDIAPSPEAQATLRTIYKNKMARKLAGKDFIN